MAPGPAIAQQLGPMGVNLGKVIADVNKETSGYKGMKVPVEIDVDPKSKNYKIVVFSPPVAELIKKEAGIEKGSGDGTKNKVGNLAFESVLGVAKAKHSSLLAKDLKGAVKLVVGTCVSMGVLIDNKEAKDIEKDIDNGLYENEIKNEILFPSNEKKDKLRKHFAEVVSKQEKVRKAAEEVAKAEEATKAAEATATPAAGTTPATGATAGKEGDKKATTPVAGDKKAAASVAKKEGKKPATKKK